MPVGRYGASHERNHCDRRRRRGPDRGDRCAERGATWPLFEAHETLGGRARSSDGPYRANLGPHAIYKGGVLWNWLSERDLMPAVARPRLTGYRFH